MTHPLTVIKKCIRGIAAPLFRLRRKLPVEAEEICVKVKDLPEGVDGCRLAVVADLHLPDNIADTQELLAVLQSGHLDGILLAGDLTNRYNSLPTAEISAFLQELTAVAPIFAIAGNHEMVTARFSVYKELLQSAGITLLHNTFGTLLRKGEKLYIYGVCETDVPLPQNPPHPTVLLIHYPERAIQADKNGFVCAVCGHAHGGQVRFGKRGLFSPGQGFFPQYISGCYTVNGFPVIVSRGLGDSSLPVRVKNRPHLPIITFTYK